MALLNFKTKLKFFNNTSGLFFLRTMPHFLNLTKAHFHTESEVIILFLRSLDSQQVFCVLEPMYLYTLRFKARVLKRREPSVYYAPKNRHCPRELYTQGREAWLTIAPAFGELQVSRQGSTFIFAAGGGSENKRVFHEAWCSLHKSSWSKGTFQTELLFACSHALVYARYVASGSCFSIDSSWLRYDLAQFIMNILNTNVLRTGEQGAFGTYNDEIKKVHVLLYLHIRSQCNSNRQGGRQSCKDVK